MASNEAEQVFYTIAQEDPLGVLLQTSLDGSIDPIGTGTGIDGRGMAYDDTHGVLYATNRSDDSLNAIDVETGTASRIGALGLDATFIGLAYDEDAGILYGNQKPDGVGGRDSSLYVIDVDTGLATLVGSNGQFAPFIDGLAWVSDSPVAPFPEPASLAIFGLGALGMAGMGIRRRKKQT